MCPERTIPPAPADLFPALPADAAAHLDRYGLLVRDALRLKPKHARLLPIEIRDLSATLTDERDDFAPDYMTRPGPLAAYVHYFHPWNLYRLTRLLAALPLDLPDDALIADLGAGPLTVLTALWLARPDLRRRPLRFLCLDRAGKTLKLGLDIFRRLAPDCPWNIRIEAEHLFRLPHFLGREQARLITAANVLNELFGGPTGKRDAELDSLAGRLAAHLDPDGQMLVIEPGTRLAARRLIELRETLIENGMGVTAPCPHQDECPMPGSGNKAWCHFAFDVRGAPPWLLQLAEAARLPKERLSLSFLLARHGSLEALDNAARVVSESFALPGNLRGQYACTPRGLALLTFDAWPTPPGSLLRLSWPEQDQRDPKSGALMVQRPGERPLPPARTPAPRPPAPRPAQERNADRPVADGRPAPRRAPRTERAPATSGKPAGDSTSAPRARHGKPGTPDAPGKPSGRGKHGKPAPRRAGKKTGKKD